MALRSESLLPYVSSIKVENPFAGIAKGFENVGKIASDYDKTTREKAQHEASLAQAAATKAQTEANTKMIGEQTRGATIANDYKSAEFNAIKAFGAEEIAEPHKNAFMPAPPISIMDTRIYGKNLSLEQANAAVTAANRPKPNTSGNSNVATKPTNAAKTAQPAQSNVQNTATIGNAPATRTLDLPAMFNAGADTLDYERWDRAFSKELPAFSVINTRYNPPQNPKKPLPYFEQKIAAEVEANRLKNQNAALVNEGLGLDNDAKRNPNYWKAEYEALSAPKLWEDNPRAYAAAMQAVIKGRFADTDYEGKFAAMLPYLDQLPNAEEIKFRLTAVSAKDAGIFNGILNSEAPFSIMLNTYQSAYTGGYGETGKNRLLDWAGMTEQGRGIFEQAVESISNEIRHGLFGAALTKNESAHWEKFAPTLNDSDDVIRAKTYAYAQFVLRKGENLLKGWDITGKSYNRDAAVEYLQGLRNVIDRMEKEGWSVNSVKYAYNPNNITTGNGNYGAVPSGTSQPPSPPANGGKPPSRGGYRLNPPPETNAAQSEASTGKPLSPAQQAELEGKVEKLF